MDRQSSDEQKYGEKGYEVEAIATTALSDDAKDITIEDGLPTPVSTPTKPRFKLSAAAIIPVWIILSSTVIIYNNYIYNTLEFRYPVFLVTWHLIFAVSMVAPCCQRHPSNAFVVHRNARAEENYSSTRRGR